MQVQFVGRATELAELNDEFAMAAEGHGRVVLVTGPEGIGKTALMLRCLAQWAEEAGAVAASGDPEESGVTGGILGQLVQARPAAGEAVKAALADGRADPVVAGSALITFMHELSAKCPLVVAVDDAQWGDDLSLKALSFAARRVHSERVLCLITAQPDYAARLPSGVMRAAASHGLRLELAGLSATEVAALAQAAGAVALPGRAARRLRDHTAGVPLHVLELVRDLPGDVLVTPGVTLPAPRSLTTLVLSRLAACTADTERLVVAAAVLGSECDLADAASLAQLADPLPAFQQAVEQRLLVELETAVRRRCCFAHSLIRTAVYRDVGVSRRAQLHRAAAELTTGSLALAHRAAGCRGTDMALAEDLVARAADEQAAGQLAEAAEHLLTAAQVAERPFADQCLLAAVAALIDLGDAARARGHGAAVVAMTPSSMRSLVLGRLAILSGDCDAAEQCISDAWAELYACGQPAAELRELAAKASCELALLLLGRHRADDAASWARRGASIGMTGFTRACSRVVHCGAIAAAGQASAARVLLEADILQSSDGRGRALLRAGLGGVLLYGDDLPGSARHLDAATDPGRRDPLPLAHLLEAKLVRILVAYRSGSWDEAAALAERLVTLLEDLDLGWLLPRAHLAAVYVAAGRGHWRVALDHLAAADGSAAPQARPMDFALADARVAIAVARDDTAAVLTAAQGAVSDLELLRRLEPSTLSFWPAYAQALARAGRPAEAEAILQPCEERAHACGRRSAIGAAMRARGVLEAERGRPDAALAALDESLRCLDRLGMPMEEAMTRFERGRILRRSGQRRSAAREIGAARTLFARLGAQPFLVRCNEELGGEVSADEGASGVGLTVRQLAVAQAAAAGMLNREIATELFISVKTVEFHVAQILARLGLDSRTQIADALRDRDRTGNGSAAART